MRLTCSLPLTPSLGVTVSVIIARIKRKGYGCSLKVAVFQGMHFLPEHSSFPLFHLNGIITLVLSLDGWISGYGIKITCRSIYGLTRRCNRLITVLSVTFQSFEPRGFSAGSWQSVYNAFLSTLKKKNCKSKVYLYYDIS